MTRVALEGRAPTCGVGRSGTERVRGARVGAERGVLLSEAGLSGAHGADQWAWRCVVEGERSTAGCRAARWAGWVAGLVVSGGARCERLSGVTRGAAGARARGVW